MSDDAEINTKDEEENETNDVKFNGVGNDFSQTQPPEIIFTEVKRERNEEKENRVNGVESVDESIKSGYKLEADRAQKTKVSFIIFHNKSFGRMIMNSRMFLLYTCDGLF